MKKNSLFFGLIAGIFLNCNLFGMKEACNQNCKVFYDKNEITAKLIVGKGIYKDNNDPKIEYIVSKDIETEKFSSMSLVETFYGADFGDCPKDQEEILKKKIEDFEAAEKEKELLKKEEGKNKLVLEEEKK